MKTFTIHGMQPRHVALILFALYVLLSLCGCQQKKLVAPSTSKVAAHVGTAQRANEQAQRYNDVNMTTAQRIDAKAEVIQRYWGK